jgi:hypothetical protein
MLRVCWLVKTYLLLLCDLCTLLPVYSLTCDLCTVHAAGVPAGEGLPVVHSLTPVLSDL